MQEQFKYRYFIDGKEIDTREEYFNTTMSGDYVSYFDGDSVFSVSFSNFFDGDFKSSRQINDHEKDILDLGQIKGGSTRHKSQNGETHVEIKIKSDDGEVNCNAILDYKFSITDIKVPIKYDNLEYYAEKDYFIVTESACWNVLDFNIKNPHVLLIDTTPVEIKADWIDFISGGIKRGKIINYENPAEKTEKELEFKSISKYNIKGRGDVILVQAKSKESLLGKEVLIDGERYKVKGVETQGYLEVGNEIGLLVSKIAEKENKTEENLVFQKDSEIHKEELPPFTTNYPDDCLKRVMDVYAGNGQEYYAVNDARSEGVNEGVKRNNEGVKESNGKTNYSEINLEILDLMAERFTANKHKYPQGNMKKPIDIKSLEWALFRHVKKMIQPIETDEETYKDHLSAVLCNCSMILQQLTLQNKK